jgi:hypothetical protein
MAKPTLHFGPGWPLGRVVFAACRQAVMESSGLSGDWRWDDGGWAATLFAPPGGPRKSALSARYVLVSGAGFAGFGWAAGSGLTRAALGHAEFPRQQPFSDESTSSDL